MKRRLTQAVEAAARRIYRRERARSTPPDPGQVADRALAEALAEARKDPDHRGRVVAMMQGGETFADLKAHALDVVRRLRVEYGDRQAPLGGAEDLRRAMRAIRQGRR